LEDTEQNVATKTHFSNTDLTQALKDIRVKTRQGRQDINRTASRGLQTLGYQEQNQQTQGARAQADFNTSLASIARSFGQLGQRQAESANAAGVLDAGTQAASASARAGNQSRAEAPIHTAQQRAGEDLTTALQRIATSKGQVGEDQSQSLGRLNEARDRERLGAHRATARQLFEDGRELERARREGKISQAQLLEQEIYAAHRESPAIFRQWASQHPGAVPGSGGGGAGSERKQKGGH
jgi:hypothetical protein